MKITKVTEDAVATLLDDLLKRSPNNYTGYADKYYGGYFTPNKVAVMVYHPTLDARMNVSYQSTKKVQLLRC